MKILIVGGTRTASIVDMLSRYNFELEGSTNISDALTQVTTTKQVDQLLLFDDALMLDGKLLDIKSVFSAMNSMSPVNRDMEILLITHVEKIYNRFTEEFLISPNARCCITKSITSKLVVDFINGKDIVEEKEVEEEQPNIVLESIVEDVPEVTIQEQPVEKPIEPVIPTPPKKVKETKEKKKRVKKSEASLSELIKSNKIYIVTGIENTGVSSTICEIANILSMNNVYTTLVDLDTITKRTTNYFSEIDKMSDIYNNNGLSCAVKDPTNIRKNIIAVKPNLDMLGTSSSISKKYLEDVNEHTDIIADIVSSLSVYSNVTLIHMPLNLIFKHTELIRLADQIIFCCNCNINSIQTIDSILTLEKTTDYKMISTLNVIYKKLCYLLTNYIPNTITSDNWLEHVEDLTEQEELHSPIVGVLAHRANFDDFTDRKNLWSNTKEGKQELEDIARRILTL